MCKDSFKDVLLPPLKLLGREQPSIIGKIVIFCCCVFEERPFVVVVVPNDSFWGEKEDRRKPKKKKKSGRKGEIRLKNILKSSQKVYATSKFRHEELNTFLKVHCFGTSRKSFVHSIFLKNNTSKITDALSCLLFVFQIISYFII